MKKLVSALVILTLFGLPVFAQKSKSQQPIVIPELPVNAETNLISYTKVVELPGINKDDLYKKAFSWINGYYKNPGDVLREKNPEDGSMLIKARFKIFNEADKKGVVTAAGDVMYSLMLNFKEGKYKYEISKINWQQTSAFPIERWKDTTSPTFSPSYPYYLTQTDTEIKKIVASLEAAMAAVAKDKKDDW